MKSKLGWWGVLVFAAWLAVFSWRLPPDPRPQPILTVFAAASLQEGLDALAAAWKVRSGQSVVVSYAGSATLARQIEQGAPADVFVSADQAWMDYLQARGLLAAGSRFDLAGNRLVLVAPAADPAPVDLAAPGALAARLGDQGRLAVAEVETVPGGRYAREALQATGHWDALAGRLSQSDSVRTALNYVARGEAPLGIVYATDARAEPRVAVVARFDPGSHGPIRYPVARLARSPAARADGFLAWLRGPEALAILQDHGFGAP